MRTHYPRTAHLPWSPGATSDDVRIADLSALTGREVVVTEKLDGENTTLYADGLHARSLDSAHHPSRGWVKALQGRIATRIPAGWRVCGENMFARHSIPYDRLEGYFYGFSVWDGERCLGWDRTVVFLRGLGIPAAPVLWRGVFDARAEKALRTLKPDTGRAGGLRRPAGGRLRRTGVRAGGGEVGAARPCTDQHPLDARRRGGERARPGRRPVGRTVRGAGRRGGARRSDGDDGGGRRGRRGRRRDG